ncbi:DUF2252 domain-containing protein [Pengzhenrongella frigida]|uniref:DUF2252 domain-containing protein n=1 Tax=Pengzhenrongella frigida TaxID=1259133 RepID=UPI001F5C5130|nr:DUF2252 domain-containing protein [Cellulomonas sp. HLT2-17]
MAHGKATRAAVPLESHALLSSSDLRPDPVELLARQAASRVPELVPIRYGRMLVSPFTFYRGAALVMASDLGGTPHSGLSAQLCGDAHLSNFGVFASPERHLVFDANDFDETLPGPFEWDVKRLAASLEIAGRDNGFKRKERRAVVLAAARGYREAMRTFATQTNLEVWYAHLDLDQELPAILAQLKPARAKLTEQAMAKARTRDSMQAFNKLAKVEDGRGRIISDPPLIVPVTELFSDEGATELFGQLRTLLRSYRRSLQSDRRHLLEEFTLVDMARKVVGVGSVGTRAWILLMEGVDQADPMFLQAKEAQASVLEDFAGTSLYANHGARVVAGQHLMQASSDIFLGWQRTKGIDGVERDYYIRQLRDWKGALPPEEMIPGGMAIYGRLCGWTLARAHARSGDRLAIAAYLGGKDTFDQAIADFATAYADLNEKDHAALQAAADAGRITVQTGL